MLLLVTVITNASFMVVVPPILISTAQIMVQTRHGTMTRSSLFTPSTCTSGWLAGQESELFAKSTWQQEGQVGSITSRARMLTMEMKLMVGCSEFCFVSFNVFF